MDASGGDGWGSFTSFADAAMVQNTMVWGYDFYQRNATAFLQSHPESNIAVLGLDDYVVLASAVATYLQIGGKAGWQKMRQNVEIWLEEGKLFIAKSFSSTIYNHPVSFTGNCKPSCTGGQTLNTQDFNYVTILRPDFFQVFSPGQMANAMVHEFYHADWNARDTQGNSPGHCLLYKWAAYWTTVNIPPPQQMASMC